MSTVLIGITTYKRPQMLEAALRSLESLSGDADIEVLVADNDPAAMEGVAVTARLAESGYRFPLSAVSVSGRGFTYGRNAILKHGFASVGAEFVITMDDDQLVAPEWLAVLLRVQLDTGAAVVGPAVIPAFERAPPRWAASSKTYNRDNSTTGSVDRLYGDGGVLMSRAVVALAQGELYDHSFALSGGADAELFTRLAANGATFARAANAIIYERYPPSRVTVRWALQRAFRIGNSDIRISRKLDRARLKNEWIRIPAALLILPIATLLTVGRPEVQVDCICRMSRAFGKLAALFGARYQEYVSVHGS